MKAILALLLAFAPAASATPDTAGQDRIMDEIERKLRLPRHSRPFDDYARYYALDETGAVIGRYIIPRKSTPEPGTACEQLDEKGGWRKVECEPVRPWPEGGVAGRRYWVAGAGELPIVFDGGCNVLNVRLDRKSDAVEAGCNGG